MQSGLLYIFPIFRCIYLFSYLHGSASHFANARIKHDMLQGVVHGGLFFLGLLAALLVSIPVAVATRVGWGGQALILIALESSFVLFIANILMTAILRPKGRDLKHSQRQVSLLIGVGYLAVMIFTTIFLFI